MDMTSVMGWFGPTLWMALAVAEMSESGCEDVRTTMERGKAEKSAVEGAESWLSGM